MRNICNKTILTLLPFNNLALKYVEICQNAVVELLVVHFCHANQSFLWDAR